MAVVEMNPQKGFARVQVPRDAGEQPDVTVEHLEGIRDVLRVVPVPIGS